MIFSNASKWTRTALSLSLAGLSFANMAYAASITPVNKAPSTSPSFVASLSGGVSWAKAGEQQTFFLTPDIEKTYTAEKPTEQLGNGELFLGIQQALFNKFQGQLGVLLAATGATNLSGEIWDDADPQFNNLSYSYKIRHRYVGVQGKLLYDADFIMPWISGSAGVGINKSYNFTNTPLIFQAVPNPNFADNTSKNFAWTLGVGVQKQFTKHWQAGIGYELANWGKARLGRADQQTLNSGLAVNHVYASGFLINVTFVA